MEQKMEQRINLAFNILLLILLSVSIGVRKGIAIFLIVSIILDPLMQRFVLWKTLKSGVIFWLVSIILLELMLGAFGIHIKGIFMYLVFFASFIGAYRFHKMAESNDFYENRFNEMGNYDNSFDSREDFYSPNKSNDDINDYKNSSQHQYEENLNGDNQRPL
ncbi:hypothetical protein [Peptoniphilus timonensis]|uniref:hypothetical protein n=1 Tax=Peptoniphilus timonensis TaxID=1268254 RepID=UPI0002DC7D15|nr:hypothetical protein [Peptoniphilus timonensis]